MWKYTIRAVPDYLPLNFPQFVRHISNLFSNKKLKHWIDYEEYSKIIGYSCRSLFELYMKSFASKELIVVTTPIHHTSFRNIIEKYVKLENIHIIELNENFNGIEKIPELDKCDLVVITHLFGQDIDISCLADFKKKHNCMIIEDRVQGGTLDKKLSHDLVDISLYSMAMDKRPVALGGGFMHIRRKYDELISILKEMIDKLPSEKSSKRLIELIKKIPTYMIYNNKLFLFFFISTLNFLSIFNKEINVMNITKSYRTNNPGFNRDNYLLKPSPGLLKSMYENFENYKQMEKLYTEKYLYFINCFSPKIVKEFFPWYRGEASLTPYNTIQIEEKLVDDFMNFTNNNKIACLTNPTYKMFNFSIDDDVGYKKFNNGIVYLPSVANMSNEEIQYLTTKVTEFYYLHRK